MVDDELARCSHADVTALACCGPPAGVNCELQRGPTHTGLPVWQGEEVCRLIGVVTASESQGMVELAQTSPMERGHIVWDGIVCS